MHGTFSANITLLMQTYRDRNTLVEQSSKGGSCVSDGGIWWLANDPRDLATSRRRSSILCNRYGRETTS